MGKPSFVPWHCHRTFPVAMVALSASPPPIYPIEDHVKIQIDLEELVHKLSSDCMFSVSMGRHRHSRTLACIGIPYGCTLQFCQ